MDIPESYARLLSIAPWAATCLILVWCLPSIIKAVDNALTNAQDRRLEAFKLKSLADEKAAEWHRKDKALDSEVINAMRQDHDQRMAEVEAELKALRVENAFLKVENATLKTRLEAVESYVAELRERKQ